MKPKKTLLKLIAVAQIAAVAFALTGCGSGSDAQNVAAQSVSGATSVPAGSVSNGDVTNPTDPNLNTGGGGGATRPVRVYGVNGYGPYKSSYITKNFGDSQTVGVDNNLRVQVVFGPAIGSSGGTYTQQYTVLRGTIELLVDYTVRDTRTFTVGQTGNSAGFPVSEIIDFSGAVNQYIFGQGDKHISFRIRNMQNDNRLVSSWCLTEPTQLTGWYTSCSGSITNYFNSSNVQNCFACSNGSWECYNVSQYNSCITRNTPVGDIQSNFGWSFTMRVELDGAVL